MKVDRYGQIILNENDLCEIILSDQSKSNLKKVLVEEKIEFNSSLELDVFPEIISYVDLNIGIEDFDKNNQKNWHMPIEYKQLDIAKFVLDQCNFEPEIQRAGQELLLFQEREMFDLLRYLKYLVDMMKTNNIVWGVGRGSSVSSFVLYLLGVHKINSLYYDLDISEFIK